MAAQDLKIDIVATDKTGAAFKSVQGGLDGIQKSSSLLSNTLAGLTSVFAAIQVAQLAKGLIDVADRMDELSKRTGIAVSELSALSNTAALAGSSQEEFASSLTRLNKAIAEAASGSKDQAIAFSNLGISVKDAQGNIRPTTDILGDVADAFSRVEDGAVKTQYQMALFGRSGANMNEFLSKGSAGIKEFGGSISEEFAKQSGDFNDNLTRIGQHIQKEFGERATPILERFNRVMSDVWKAQQLSATGIVNSQAEVRRIDNKSGKIELPPIDPKIAKAAEEVSKKLQDVNDEILKMTKGENELAIAQFARMEGVTKPQIKQYEELLRQKSILAAQDRELDAAAREADDQAKKAHQEKVDRLNKGKKITEEMRTPMEIYNETIKELNVLVNEGSIEWETYDRASAKAFEDFKKNTDPVKDQLAELKYAAEGWGRDFTNIMADAAMGGKISFADMAQSIIRDLIRIQIQRSITDPLVSAGTSALSSIFNSGGQFESGINTSGFRAMGGPVTSGNSYVVGENGPEIFTPYGSGSITPNNEIGGGGVTVNQTINVSTGVQQTVRAEIMGLMPQISNAAKAAVADAKLRGGNYGKMMA
jgi:hypothetical protein